MKNILLLLSAFIGICMMALLVNTLIYPFEKLKVFNDETYKVPASFEKNLQRFIGGIRIPTVTADLHDGDISDADNFKRFRDYLHDSYPTVYEHTKSLTINQDALILKWPGRNPKLKPILFNAHYDVSPLSDEADWTYGGPFSGTIKNGAIYGRGAMDMKGMLFALMDAAEMLMQKGFVPQRDIYFAFGPDGEVGGANGSGPISLFLKEMGIQLETVFNEGGMIIKIPANNQVYGMAVIGIAEKGLLSLQINVRNKGGLSAMPDSDSAWGNAAIIMQRLENKQMKARILPEIDVIMRSVGYMMDFKYRFIIANKYIFENILLNALSRNPMTNAIIRTTTALTQAQGGSLNAVLPLVARVVVNFRLLPGDTADDVIKHVTEASQGFDVTLTKLEHRNPSRFSSTTSSAFDKIVAAIREIYPTANILPYVTIDGTDASNYEIVADNVYRFMPVAVTLAQQSAMHNADEHISINNYLRMVMYFETLMRNYDAQ